jgi:hypothetical protein
MSEYARALRRPRPLPITDGVENLNVSNAAAVAFAASVACRSDTAINTPASTPGGARAFANVLNSHGRPEPGIRSPASDLLRTIVGQQVG